MTINVYWSVLNKEWSRAKEPESLYKNFFSKRLHENNDLMNFNRCPFIFDYLKNVFILRSLYSYKFKIKDEGVVSDFYDQEFFDNHVVIRSIEKKCFSFIQSFIFFTDEKSLEVFVPELPYLEDNNITKRCIPFSGKMNIGKYFRSIDFPFFLKNDFDEFAIEEDEVFAYIRFLTKEKINFIPFYPSLKIIEYSKVSSSSNKGRKNFFRPTLEYYKNFKIKKIVLKEIEKNLL
jgi:hypothetical protein